MSETPRTAPDPPEGGGTPLAQRWWPVGALVGVLALATVATLLAWGQYSDARDRAITDLRTKVVLTNRVLDVYFGQALGTLSSIAKAPAVVEGDLQKMQSYVRRVQPPNGTLFPGGLGWIDRQGISQVSSAATQAGPGQDLSDRSYFKAVMRTGKPFVSEGLVARSDPRRRIVTMAVPTRDAKGKPSGVLVGALLLNATRADSGVNALGLQGINVFDRSGQSLFQRFARPGNAALLRQIRRSEQGVLTDARGFDGESDRVVAYANVPVAGWTLAIDRARSSVFADARRALLLELALIGAVAVFLIWVIGVMFLRARRVAQRRQVRELLRSELARTLGATTAVSEVAGAVASALEVAFPAALGVIALTAGDDGRLRVSARSEGALPERLAARQDVLDRVAALAEPSARVVAMETRAEIRQRVRELDAVLGGAAGSVYLLPLMTGAGRRSGVLVLLFGAEHGLNSDEQSLIASHAEQAARALERARVQEREHTVAITLQRSLLSEALPEVESLDLAARYEAGSAGLEVGGDWYDVVVRPDGVVMVTVGDVAGRGVTAATLMGRLRSAYRAYAYDVASPGEVLRRLVRHVASDEMATAVVLSVDPYTREVVYASAGHLPPVLADVGTGETQLLDAAGGPPLGAVPLADVAVVEASFTLPARAGLIAYTDGLIERRGESIDVGIELVASVMATTTSLDADRIAGQVLAQAAARDGGEDDIALLVLRSVDVPQRMAIEIPAGTGSLRTMRHRVMTWLALRGVDDEEQRADAVLAVSEACNNAIEHAYRERGGTIRLALELEGGILRMEVEDRGLWRLDGDRGAERGRGLPIMRGIMDRVDIERRSDGTLVRFEHRVGTPPDAPLAPVHGGQREDV